MIPQRVVHLVSLIALSFLLAACKPNSPTASTQDQTDQSQAAALKIPIEFQNGTATLAQAKNWQHSIEGGDGPVQTLETTLTPTSRPALCVYDPSNEGTGGPYYMVFEKTPLGLKYVGNIDGTFRVAPPDSAGNPRLVAYWHFGADGNRITLHTLNGQFVVTSERIVNDHDEGEADNQLVTDLFKSPAVSTDLLNRAFPAASAKHP